MGKHTRLSSWLRTFTVMVVMVLLYLLAIIFGGGWFLYAPIIMGLLYPFSALEETNLTLYSFISLTISIMVICLPIIVMMFCTNWLSILTLKSFKAQEFKEEDAPNIYKIVKRLANTANLPMPKLYIYEDKIPNAFATGRDPKNSAIVISVELLDKLDNRQLTGVLAHELAHIKNRDTLTNITAMFLMRLMVIIPAAMSAIAFIIGTLYHAISSRDNEGGHWVAYFYGILWAAVSAFLGFLGTVLIMSLSRNREFAADRTGAEISGDPLGLASALETLEDRSQNAKANVPFYAAHLLIHHPVSSKRFSGRFFSTHPSIERRIARLKSMADSSR